MNNFSTQNRTKNVFNNIYRNNLWNDPESVSGSGSTLAATGVIRDELPRLLNKYCVQSLLDIPCGDTNWFPFSALPDGFRYIGADIVPELVDNAREKHYALSPVRIQFATLDATKDPLPKVDMIFCRDMLGHLTKRDVFAALNNFRASGSTWLLSTTFPEHETLHDIATGEWRPINLASMYGLPDPLLLINEGVTVKEFADKSLGLWKLNDD